MPEVLRDALRALSLSGLCLMTSWIELHFVGPKSAYYLPSPPARVDHEAAILLTFILGGLFFAAIRAARLASPRTRGLLCLPAAAVIALVPLNSLRIYTLPVGVGRLPAVHPLIAASLLAAVLLIGVVLVLRWWKRTLNFAATGALLLAPFTAWMCARSVVAIASWRDPQAGQHLAGRLHDSGPSETVVWLIFDEFDYGVAFERRPAGLDLPEFDRLRRESIFATNAYPAGSQTIVAVTSLLVGQRLLTVEPETDADFSAATEGAGQPVTSKETTSLFRRVRDHHHDTWVVGWALPYCRTWAPDLSGCVWEPAFTSALGRAQTVAASLRDQAYAMSPYDRRRLAALGYRRVLAAAEEQLRRSDPGLTFVHLPIPHPPPIYDRINARLTIWETSPVRGYMSNLALADRALGHLRRVMEEAGTWDKTTVLVTADHPWRQAHLFDGRKDRRVPFLLKLAGQKQGSLYDSELDTVRTGSLLLGILDGRLSRPSEIIRWLDRR